MAQEYFSGLIARPPPPNSPYSATVVGAFFIAATQTGNPGIPTNNRICIMDEPNTEESGLRFLRHGQQAVFCGMALGQTSRPSPSPLRRQAGDYTNIVSIKLRSPYNNVIGME